MSGATAVGAAATRLASQLDSPGRQNCGGRISDADARFVPPLLAIPAIPRACVCGSYRASKLDDAVKNCKLLCKLGFSGGAHYARAVYLEQKKPELARVELQKALKLAPTTPKPSNCSSICRLPNRGQKPNEARNEKHHGVRRMLSVFALCAAALESSFRCAPLWTSRRDSSWRLARARAED